MTKKTEKKKREKKPDNWREMSKEDRWKWRTEHRPGAVKAEGVFLVISKLAGQVLDLQPTADLDEAVDEVLDLVDEALALPPGIEQLSDLVLLLLKPVIRDQVRRAFDLAKASPEE